MMKYVGKQYYFSVGYVFRRRQNGSISESAPVAILLEIALCKYL